MAADNRRRGGLSATLRNLIAKSESDHRPHEIRLERGLLVGIHVRDANQVQLLLSRPGIYPSRQEWNICCRSLPEHYRPLPETMPSEYMHEGRHWLSATWPIQSRML